MSTIAAPSAPQRPSQRDSGADAVVAALTGEVLRHRDGLEAGRIARLVIEIRISGAGALHVRRGKVCYRR